MPVRNIKLRDGSKLDDGEPWSVKPHAVSFNPMQNQGTCADTVWRAAGAQSAMHLRPILIATLMASALSVSSAMAQALRAGQFADPPPDFRPTVTTEEGAGYAAPLEASAKRAMDELGAGAIMISPQRSRPQKPLDLAGLATVAIGLQDSYPETATPWLPKALPGEAKFGSYLSDGRAGPGAGPSLGYMTPEWFAMMRQLLGIAKQRGLTAVYYDEAGFPSGSADGTIPSHYYRQILRRSEVSISSGQQYSLVTDASVVAVVAIDTASGKRVDLFKDAKNDRILWIAPRGNWQVQAFSIVRTQGKDTSPDYYATADYLDEDATRWFLSNAHDRAYRGLSDYFGSTIKYTFFDDVGIYSDEKTWHPGIAVRFERLTGRSASLYYPALWEDIGPETSAARVAFFRARSEQLGDTFPKLLTDWAHAHGVKSTGHAPGNYDIQPTDTIGDPFKFYAHTDMPMADVLWGVGFARGGFKLISSVSAQRDLPRTAAEAFSVDNDANGYRRMIELYVRGFNYFVTGARVPSRPLGTGAELSRWAGRSSYLLQGGRHVADIAVVFPIESLQAFYAFNDPRNGVKLPAGAHAYQDADYQAVGEMLLSELHRDFTFVHPDALGSDKLTIKDNRLHMANRVNDEDYRVLVLPGGAVISVAALAKIKAFYDAGGTVIATSLLPSHSAEFGRDAEVRALVADIFGTGDPADEPVIHRNASGGKTVFIAKPSAAILGAVLERLNVSPDVGFMGPPPKASAMGTFGYIHRQRAGKDIYYFGNSGDSAIEATVTVRGKLNGAEFWDPHSGKTTRVSGLKLVAINGETRTQFRLSLPALHSLAVVGRLQ